MKRGIVILALLALPACAFSARTVGQKDPTVEAIKALTEVLKQAPFPTPLPAATPTPTPVALCIGTDNVTVRPCEEIR